jgi:hypothetical protein
MIYLENPQKQDLRKWYFVGINLTEDPAEPILPGKILP